MAKGSSSSAKLTFGARKGGKARKGPKKKCRKERNYRGQGR